MAVPATAGTLHPELHPKPQVWTKYPVLHLPWRKCRVIPSNSSEEETVTAQESRAVKEKGKRE